MSFRVWLELQNEDVDETQVNAIWNRVHLAVDFVRKFDATLPQEQRLLKHVATIANLSQNVYGLFNSSELWNSLPQDKRNQPLQFPSAIIDKHGYIGATNLVNQSWFNIQQKQIIDATKGVIHINVMRHIKEFGKTLEAIIELGATIAHESQHELDKIKNINPTEKRAIDTETQFKIWARKYVSETGTQILKNYPDLAVDAR